MKKYILLSLLLIISLTFIGCSSSTNQEEKGEEAADFNKQDDFMDLPEASLEDLEIEIEVSVMGSESSKGIIIAERIIIGGKEGDFKMPERDGEMPEGFDPGEMPDKGERPDRSGSGEGPRGNMPGASSGSVMVSGTIIDKDDSSITLRLEAGGSKLVFLSEGTEIFTLPQN